MTKTEIIRKVSENTGMTQKSVGIVVDSLIDVVGDSLREGERVKFIGFGTFETKNCPARLGRNPKTGERIKVKACKSPVFKAGKLLKKKVNGDR